MSTLSPVADDDTAQTDEDEDVTVDVLDNDSDVDDDPLTAYTNTNGDCSDGSMEID